MNIPSTLSLETSEILSRSRGKYRQNEEISAYTPAVPSAEQKNEDTVTLSQEGQDLAQLNPSTKENKYNSSETNGIEILNRQEILEIQKLKHRDIEVRTHEMAHLAVAGKYSRGGASFTYQKGPDGVSYAVSGEVGIDIAKEKEPEQTISKMQTIRRAALAPASPSSADRSIAARASIMESQARQEILKQNQEELLHAVVAPSPGTKQETPNDKLQSGNGSSLPSYNTLGVMIATYQRVANS